MSQDVYWHCTTSINSAHIAPQCPLPSRLPCSHGTLFFTLTMHVHRAEYLPKDINNSALTDWTSCCFDEPCMASISRVYMHFHVTLLFPRPQAHKNTRRSQLVGLRADLIAKSNYIKGHDVVVFQECFDSDPYGVLSGGLRSQCTSFYSSLTTRNFVCAMQMDDAHAQGLNLIFGCVFVTFFRPLPDSSGRPVQIRLGLDLGQLLLHNH